MYKNEILEALRAIGKLEYGAVITGDEFRDICGIKTILRGTKEDFDSLALAELTFANLIRDKLLNEGKYFKQNKGNYRVLLPSENQEQVISFMQSADNKLKRGMKLDKNTPTEYKINDNNLIRMAMKQESIKRRI